MIVVVNGSRRTGAAAWPGLVGRGEVREVALRAGGTIPGWVDQIRAALRPERLGCGDERLDIDGLDGLDGLDRLDGLDKLDGLDGPDEFTEPGEPITLVAHSLGAVPAVLALRGGDYRVGRLVLVEPALYDVARGDPAIERHIGIMTTARDALAGPSMLDSPIEGYWRVVRPLMFGGPFDAAAWADERQIAEAFAASPVPWGHGIRPMEMTGTPTTVATGGWNDEYEAIASRLAEAGAETVVLSGHGHRPQDHPAFLRMVGLDG